MNRSASPSPSSGRGAAWHTRWQAWQATLPALLQRQAHRTYRRWIYACSAFAVGAAGVWLAHADVLDGFWHNAQSLEALRRQVASTPVALTSAPASADPQQVAARLKVLDHLPGLSAQERLWPTLQQTLARQHLQLLSFRPVDEAMAAPLPSLAVALRLRGHFDDWVRAWAGMSEGMPVWSMERVHIHPLADSSVVEVDVLLRVWLRAGPDGPLAWQGQGAAEAPSAPRGQQVFVNGQRGDLAVPAGLLTQERELANTANPLASGDSPDPKDWSPAGLRLLGIWQEAETRYAILAFGAHWVRAREGQRVSREGHRLEAIGDRSVRLRAGPGPALVLNFEQGSR